jgi:hypothetical protein
VFACIYWHSRGRWIEASAAMSRLPGGLVSDKSWCAIG